MGGVVLDCQYNVAESQRGIVRYAIGIGLPDGIVWSRWYIDMDIQFAYQDLWIEKGLLSLTYVLRLDYDT